MPDRERPLNVAFIPSVSGGLGHVTRTLKIARALERADASLNICYVLSELWLRPFNREAVERTDYPVRILPNPSREHRDREIAAVMGDIDVVIEDTERRLIPYRFVLPRLKAWISIPMLPLWDELFMESPFLEHADHILYALPAALPLPEELERFRERVTVTGPTVDVAEVPSRAEARARLRIGEEEAYITYAPRGYPFGPEFGVRVLDALVGAFMRLREERPKLGLVLTAVPKVAEVQPPELPPLETIAGVTVHGMLPPETVLDYLAGADLVVLEGTSTLFDAAIARVPVLMVPGTIYETWAEGMLLWEHNAGVVEWIERVTRESMLARMREALDPAEAPGRAERLFHLIGSGGTARAVEAVLRVIDARVRS